MWFVLVILFFVLGYAIAEVRSRKIINNIYKSSIVLTDEDLKIISCTCIMRFPKPSCVDNPQCEKVIIRSADNLILGRCTKSSTRLN